MMTIMIWLLGAALLIGPSIYRLLPILACYLDDRLAAANLSRLFMPQTRRGQLQLKSWLPQKLGQKVKIRLQKAGWFSDRAVLAFFISQVMPLPILILVGLLAGINTGQATLTGIVLISLINARISSRIMKRQKAFIKALYKIYRFLDLQVTAGIKITDSLRGLPEAVEDGFVRPILIRFAALYELTLDLDLALEEVRLAFPGLDCELLATHLRQCLQTGEVGRSLARMEELLFARYFNLMQADTRHIRTQLLLTAMLGILPGIALFLYPLLYQAAMAMQSVFG